MGAKVSSQERGARVKEDTDSVDRRGEIKEFVQEDKIYRRIHLFGYGSSRISTGINSSTDAGGYVISLRITNLSLDLIIW